MNDRTPAGEIQSRLNRYGEYVLKFLPQAEGSLIFSRLNIYYFTGTFANGVLWVPSDGKSVLFCRRGLERAKIESPLEEIMTFNSYADIKNAFSGSGRAIPGNIAAEMNGLPWSLSNSLKKHFSGATFFPADNLIAMTRAKKSEWELKIIREAGKKHGDCLARVLPKFLREGITELQVAHKLSEILYSEGHQGVFRMSAFGEEAFLGHIAAGESANYPSFFNGPVGLRGVNPAVPFMGSGEVEWKKGFPLIVDNGFTLKGYQTDKTQVYWLGGEKNIPDQVRDPHRFCVDIQNTIAEQLKPGAIPQELWKRCGEMVSKSPWREGFMGLGGNQVKFLGHGIGLAIDEYPVIADGFDQPLEEGMVMALEPKIGIPGIGMVGTENTFEVTNGGGMSLTGDDFGIIPVS